MDRKIKEQILNILQDKTDISIKVEVGHLDKHSMNILMKTIHQRKGATKVDLDNNELAMGIPENVALLFETLKQVENLNRMAVKTIHSEMEK